MDLLDDYLNCVWKNEHGLSFEYQELIITFQIGQK